ncbi:MAG: hypothetical protein U9N10_01275 [Bacillota bacterium]|nr:hypothetical protein [Bacillota bacterium]
MVNFYLVELIHSRVASSIRAEIIMMVFFLKKKMIYIGVIEKTKFLFNG